MLRVSVPVTMQELSVVFAQPGKAVLHVTGRGG